MLYVLGSIVLLDILVVYSCLKVAEKSDEKIEEMRKQNEQ